MESLANSGVTSDNPALKLGRAIGKPPVCWVEIEKSGPSIQQSKASLSQFRSRTSHRDSLALADDQEDLIKGRPCPLDHPLPFKFPVT
jgi:hypothetical protein